MHIEVVSGAHISSGGDMTEPLELVDGPPKDPSLTAAGSMEATVLST
jgi:hypothetical protein